MHIRQEVKDVARFEQIVKVFFSQGMGYLVHKLRLKDFLTLNERLQKNKFEEFDTKPHRVKAIIEDLGGAFIKLGQLLSLRPDLIPTEYCKEFSKLQDDVKPFPAEIAKGIIETALKRPISQVFSEFNSEPLAAASIGQVHRAKLKTGEEVVVKVQRPDIENTMNTDIDIMYYIVDLLETHHHSKLIDYKEIVKEFERYTKEELDFVKEASNIERFYVNFKNDKHITIPKVYREFSTKRVLVMEYLPGKKLMGLEKKKEPNKKKLTKIITDAIFKQFFIDGFFHADPHPGNILIIDNSRVAFIDFGIVGEIDDALREKIFSLFQAMINKNVEEVAEILLDIGVADIEINIETLKRDIKDGLGRYYGANVGDIDFVDAFERIMDLARKDKIKFASDFILLGKAIITLESVAVSLNPQFNLVDSAKPFIKNIIKKMYEPKAILQRLRDHTLNAKEFVLSIPHKTNVLLYKIKEADLILRELDEDIQGLTVEMDRSSNRISYAMIITGLVIASALLTNYNRFVIFGVSALSFLGFTAAGILAIILALSILREKKR